MPGPAGPTITAPGQLTTIFQTLPAETVVIPASTITLPAQTTTIQGAVITLPAVTVTAPAVTTQLPPVTQTIVQTLSIPGPTVTQTQTNVQDIVVCPQPTPTPGMPSGPQPFNYTWGCPPGLVCSPRKPFACDVFASLPDPSYRCQPSECIPAPKREGEPESWPSNETGFFYPPIEGYFDLNPNYFGLSYEIFGQEIVDIGGTLVTTGNWQSQATLPTQPARTNVVVPDPRFDDPRTSVNQKAKRQQVVPDTVPTVCFPLCNRCVRDAESVGKVPELCLPNSNFNLQLANCRTCAEAGGDFQQINLRQNVIPDVQQWLDFCSVTPAREVVPDDGPQEQVSETTVAGSTAVQSQAPPRTITSQATTKAAQTSEVVVTSTPNPTTEILTSTFVASTSSPSRSTTVVTPTPSSLPSSSIIIETSTLETSTSETPTPTTSEETTLSTELNAPIGSSTASEFPEFTTSALPTFTGAAQKIGGSAMGLVIAMLGAFMALA